MRQWLCAPLKEGENTYDSIEGKLLIIHAILQTHQITRDQTFELQALGLAFGDALAQKLGLSWVISETSLFGRSPVLQLPGKSSNIGAFTAIQKRVVQGETFKIYSLFDAFCQSFERVLQPKRSFLARLFGKRVV